MMKQTILVKTILRKHLQRQKGYSERQNRKLLRKLKLKKELNSADKLQLIVESRRKREQIILKKFGLV